MPPHEGEFKLPNVVDSLEHGAAAIERELFDLRQRARHAAPGASGEHFLLEAADKATKIATLRVLAAERNTR